MTLAMFVRDKNARFVGFTNSLCSAICDPCRKSMKDEPEERFDVEMEPDSSVAWS